MRLSIGGVATRAGVSVDTLRYYEREGVLPPAERDAGGRRVYDETILDALVLVRALREAGFGILEVRDMTALKGVGTPAERAAAVLDQCDRLDAALDDRARLLRNARRTVRRMRAEVADYLAAGAPGCGAAAADDGPGDGRGPAAGPRAADEAG